MMNITTKEGGKKKKLTLMLKREDQPFGFLLTLSKNIKQLTTFSFIAPSQEPYG